MQTPRIVLIGHVCIDHNTTENATYTSWGSSVLYMAHYLQSSGLAMPQVLASYGPDLLPYVTDVQLLPHQPNQPRTLVYENDTRSLPRIWKAHHTEVAIPAPTTPEVIKALQAADIVIIATLLPNYGPDYIAELLGHTKPGCLTALCPQGYLRHINPDGLVVPRTFDEARQVVPQFDMVIFSEEDSPQAFAMAEDWQRQAAAAATEIIVTQGPNGASYINRSGRHHIPTQPLDPADIVDSVGCGDIFAITAIYDYYRSKDIQQAINAAHQAAARKLRAVAPAASTQPVAG